jgi:hypothetical protein
MSAYRDSLRPEQLTDFDAAISAAAQILARARHRRDSLPPEEAAELAYVPGGPSREEIAEMIRQQRARAKARQVDAA